MRSHGRFLSDRVAGSSCLGEGRFDTEVGDKMEVNRYWLRKPSGNFFSNTRKVKGAKLVVLVVELLSLCGNKNMMWSPMRHFL